MWLQITADPQANSICVGNSLAKTNPEEDKDAIIYTVTNIEGDGLLVLERQYFSEEKILSQPREQIKITTKRYPSELIGEWWVNS